MIELAKAVLEQWVKDGKPAADKEAVEYWRRIIKDYGT